MADELKEETIHDPIEDFLSNYGVPQDTDEIPQDEPEEQEQEQEEEPVEVTSEPEEVVITEDKKQEPAEDDTPLTPEEELEFFNRITGLGIKDRAQLEEFAGAFTKWPEYKKNLDLYPQLIEKLKTSQDVMSYFPDEATFKLAQLSKDEKYKGKEVELTKVLKSDLTQLADMEAIELHAKLNAPAGVKNPLRFTIRKMGLDPDEVIGGFDELSDDDKDLIFGHAALARQELSVIGKDISVPKSSVDDIEALLQQQSNLTKEDFEKKKADIAPVAMTVVEGIKEFKVSDDFVYKLDLGASEKSEYSDFLTHAVLSGDFDVSTEEGKQELYSALMDEIWVDNRTKIIKAYETNLRSKIEAEMREKYNNETPLRKETPKPEDKGKKASSLVDIVNDMIKDRT